VARLSSVAGRYPAAAALTAAGLVAFAADPRVAAQAPTQDTRPTVAVMYFTNAALVRNEEYAPLSRGIAEMLITKLAGNAAIRVVERDQLQKLLEEQNLGATGRVDLETAVRLGRVLGARHFILGGFVIDPKENMRLDLRAVDVETSRIEYAETVSGKAENLLDLIEKLGDKVNAGLKLPPTARAGSSRLRPGAGGEVSSKGAKVNEARAVLLLGRGLMAKDAGNTQAAAAAYREALSVYPGFPRAQLLLEAAERPKPNGS
jgi:TolB-like protein